MEHGHKLLPDQDGEQERQDCHEALYANYQLATV